MRMHYACSTCRTRLECDPALVVEVVLYKDRQSPRELGKLCCFCPTPAQFRIRTDAPSRCPAGHIPPARLAEIWERAAEASIADHRKRTAEESPALDMFTEVDIEKP